jgi:hypothetical protein
MIHPTFETIPDPQMAEACSDMLQSDAYAFATDIRVTGRYGAEGFPPVPAEFVTVTAAYAEHERKGFYAHTQLAVLQPAAASASQITRLYNLTVQSRHDLQPELIAVTSIVPELQGNIDRIQQWCGQLAVSEGRKLFAAHLTARVVSDGRLIDTLVYPKVIRTEFPLLLRDAMVPNLDQINRIIAAGLVPEVNPADFKEASQAMLRRDEIASAMAVLAVASFLPDIRMMRPALKDRLRS